MVGLYFPAENMSIFVSIHYLLVNKSDVTDDFQSSESDI